MKGIIVVICSVQWTFSYFDDCLLNTSWIGCLRVVFSKPVFKTNLLFIQTIFHKIIYVTITQNVSFSTTLFWFSFTVNMGDLIILTCSTILVLLILDKRDTFCVAFFITRKSSFTLYEYRFCTVRYLQKGFQAPPPKFGLHKVVFVYSIFFWWWQKQTNHLPILHLNISPHTVLITFSFNTIYSKQYRLQERWHMNDLGVWPLGQIHSLIHPESVPPSIQPEERDCQ